MAAKTVILDQNGLKLYTKLYRQIVDIPMGTNCAPLVADFFYSAMKEISRKIFLVITRSTLLRHST